MNIWKVLIPVWIALSTVSLVIAAACIWVDSHGAASILLERYRINHLTVFVWSALTPFILAMTIAVLGFALMLLRWILRRSLHIVMSFQGRTMKADGAARSF